MNPFLAFCLYVAARVFIQYLKFRPKDEQMISSLQFLLAAMHALKRKNPLTESFLVQLDVDLEGMNIDVGPRVNEATRAARMCEVTINDNLDCSPLLQIRDSQAQSSALNQNSRPTAYSTGFPNNPNGVNTINVDFNMMNNANSPSYNLPNRQKSGVGPASIGRVTSISDSLSPPGSDNAPSPANERGSSRSNSSKDASSHTSFTPPSVTEDTNSQRTNNIPNVASPQNTGTVQTPAPFGTFYNSPLSTMDNNFSNFQPNFFSQPVGESPGFGMANFDMSTVDINMSTGMTPMATDSDWNRMMEDMDRFAAANNPGPSGNG
jgi:hypothetical protein